MSSFYSREELIKMGFASLGTNVFISKKASIYAASNISIGSNIRIDDFCILSGTINLGNNIHISPYLGIYAGKAGVDIGDFVSLSSRTAIYAINDDYSGNGLVNPTIPDKYRNVSENKVILKKHCLIGTGTTILPGVILEEGVAVGSMSLVKHSLEGWDIYAGTPVKKLKNRSKSLLELEEEYKNNKYF